MGWLKRFLWNTLRPSEDKLMEAVAYLFLGLGVFIGIALWGFDAADSYSHKNILSQISDNPAGPFGAWLAKILLTNLGIVSALIPVAMILLGSLLVLGFIQGFSLKRLFAFVWFILLASPASEVWLKPSASDFPTGGAWGKFWAELLQRNLGELGSLVVIVAVFFIGLSLSGNIALSEIGPFFRNSMLWIYNKLKYFLFAKWADHPDEEELVREALAKIALASAQKRGEIDPRIRPEDILHARKKEGIRKESHAKDLVHTASSSKSGFSEGSEESGDSTTEDGAAISFYFNSSKAKRYTHPGAELFARSEKIEIKKDQHEKLAKKLGAQLLQFKVEGKIVGISEGPVVTTCEYEPAPGTKISKIVSLSEDLARMLEAKSLRILAPIPGKNTVGFEVPQAKRKSIGFADLIDSKMYKSSKMGLPVAMGMDTFGTVVIEDLAKMPHLLVAGSTGSGKSVFMNTLIASLICKHGPKDLRFVMVDPKMVELAAYNKLPHLALPVVTDPTKDAKQILEYLVAEMEDRFKRMGAVGARNIDGFNEVVKEKKKSAFKDFQGPWEPLPFIVLIIDELADMMMVLGKDAEIPITRLAQKARAAGIHLVIATQRPSAEVVTGLIKANFPTRVAFRVLSGLDSRTILDSSGAEGLLGQGDMLYLSAGGIRRMHGAYLSDKELAKMVQVASSS